MQCGSANVAFPLNKINVYIKLFTTIRNQNRYSNQFKTPKTITNNTERYLKKRLDTPSKCPTYLQFRVFFCREREKERKEIHCFLYIQIFGKLWNWNKNNLHCSIQDLLVLFYVICCILKTSRWNSAIISSQIAF